MTLCVPTYHMHNNNIVAGRALEWVRMFEGQVGFLDMKYQVCFPPHMALCVPNWSKYFQQIELHLAINGLHPPKIGQSKLQINLVCPPHLAPCHMTLDI